MKTAPSTQSQLQEFFETQRSSLNYFFEHVNINAAEELVDFCNQVKGTFFFTGVGKSGFIAQKVTASFVSMGIKAHFLSPIDALHGDLGVVHKDDVVFFFSKSGESEEILNLIPFIRNREVKIVAVVSNTQSRLAQASDFVMYLPMDKELCPHDMIPTTSTEIQLIFGDILSIGLMKKKKLSLEQFAFNHPAGKIGRRLGIRVQDLMLKDQKIPLCSPENLLTEILQELSIKRCGCVLVVDSDKHLKGIFTDGDLRRALEKHGSEVFNLPIHRLQTINPKVIHQKDLAWDALKLMESNQKHPVTVLPVVADSRVVGLIKMHDILQSGVQ
ncbi:MAG: Arabinose 5-phosphate isomerase KdsD [Chlamydiae bacterium]|nr:Arabinose 5-phosphate isomerase KdsD [Chlamydiota bacterium]